MSRIVEFATEFGDPLLVEISDVSSRSPITRGGSTNTLETSTARFEESVKSIMPAAGYMLKQFAELSDGVQSVNIKFGMKFSAEAGIFIASAASEASFEIQVTWARTGE